jgi:FKBP-type peptidyl-prolyl cis-trans isomerase FkpA
MTHFRPKTSFKSTNLSFLTLFLLIVGLCNITACSKSDSNNDTSNPTACTLKAQYVNDSSASQRALMAAFCNNNGIKYTVHPSGILYEITAAGDTAKPNLCTSITMTYKGKLMTGIQFDAGTITYPLKDLIVGWQIAVPMIGKGGKIKMVIPSSLAYGANAVGTIPPNSPLYFEMSID